MKVPGEKEWMSGPGDGVAIRRGLAQDDRHVKGMPKPAPALRTYVRPTTAEGVHDERVRLVALEQDLRGLPGGVAEYVRKMFQHATPDEQARIVAAVEAR